MQEGDRYGSSARRKAFLPSWKTKSIDVSPNQEAFDVGAPENPALPNQWPEPSLLPGFRAACEAFYPQCIATRRAIFSAIARALRLAPATFDAHSDAAAGYSALRLLHYPACAAATARRDGLQRCAPHSDTGDLTLLLQDDVGGLELEDRAVPGTFRPVANTRPGEMLANVADMLQRWTNGRLRSAMHRVALPPSELAAADAHADGMVPARYSIAILGKPPRDASVGPLPAVLEAGERVMYDEMTAWQYQKRKYEFLYSVAEVQDTSA